MAIPIIQLSKTERDKLLSFQESHFGDLKGKRIAPNKLTNTISALSNAEGGELYLGVEQDQATKANTWDGFKDPEAANAHIQVFESLFPLGDGYTYGFLGCDGDPGLILRVEIAKSRDIKRASDGNVYLRRGAQNLRVTTDEGLTRLRRNKGLSSFETETVNADPATITNSTTTLSFMIEVVPTSEPEVWLAKQQLLIQGKPTVAGIVLFAEEPQALLPKRTGIKVYRYQTTEDEGTRETLLGDPLSIEGDADTQIRGAVGRTAEIIQGVRVNTPEGLEQVTYPITALHEIITNAVLHRDYSIADDIHIRIFDNRVEVVSPGTLPAHITPENILDERFARNATLVRLINKFPDPPNKDVGEGLNTAFRAMRDMKLKPPTVTQTGAAVKVVLRHEPLATPEELILQHLATNEQITNKVGRELCFIGSENKMKNVLQRMVKNGLIELVPGTTRYSAAYRLVKTKRK